MQKIILAGLAFASVAAAQTMTMPAFSNTFTASLTRGFYFQAPVGFTITGLEVYNEAAQSHQVVEIIDFGTTAGPPAFPSLVTGTSLFYDNQTATGNVIPCVVTCVPGNYYGILAACTAGAGGGTSYNSYATPSGPFTSDILGNPTVIQRCGTQIGSGAAGPNQPMWSENNGPIARCDVYVSGGAGFATKVSFGTGCNSATGTSFYENFSAGTFDLVTPVDNMTLINTGVDYLALSGLATYVAPTGAATALTLTDDSEAPVTLSTAMPVGSTGSTTSLMVCSNGFVSTGSNGTGFTPNVATMLNNPNAGWYTWHDLNPATGGTVWSEEIGGVHYITWDNVPSFGQTVGETLQFQFDLASGNVSIVWVSVSNLGNGWLVGFSEGGASADPGSIDLSALLPGSIPAAAIFDVTPLGFTGDVRPVLGTTVNLTVDNVPAGSALGAVIFGLTKHDPGIDLTSFGMPGCFQYCSQEAVQLFIAPGSTFSTAYPIPNTASLAGVHVQTQGAIYDPVGGHNPLGALSSRGLDLGLDVN